MSTPSIMQTIIAIDYKPSAPWPASAAGQSSHMTIVLMLLMTLTGRLHDIGLHVHVMIHAYNDLHSQQNLDFTLKYTWMKVLG
jgi:hypothetical protein